MKKIILTLLTLITLTLGVGVPATAGSAGAFTLVPTCKGNAAGTDACKEVNRQAGRQRNPFIHIINIIINGVSIIAGGFAVIGVLVSAIKFITAGGDSQAVAGARTTLVYSLLGIAVIALAQTIVYFVLSKA